MQGIQTECNTYQLLFNILSDVFFNLLMDNNMHVLFILTCLAEPLNTVEQKFNEMCLEMREKLEETNAEIQKNRYEIVYLHERQEKQNKKLDKQNKQVIEILKNSPSIMYADNNKINLQ